MNSCKTCCKFRKFRRNLSSGTTWQRPVGGFVKPARSEHGNSMNQTVSVCNCWFPSKSEKAASKRSKPWDPNISWSLCQAPWKMGQSLPVSLGLNPSRSPHEGGSASLLRWELSGAWDESVSKPLHVSKMTLKIKSKKKRSTKKQKMFGEDNRWVQVLSDVCQSSLQRALRRRLERTEIAESKHPRLKGSKKIWSWHQA